MAEQIEITMARLDERFQGFEKVVAQMAEDQKSLTLSYHRLVESNQRIALLENDALATRKSLDLLWKKFDDHIATNNKFTGKIFFEVLKLAGAGVAGWVASRYGVQIP